MLPIAEPGVVLQATTVSKVAVFLGIREEAVTELMEHGQLDGAILGLLRERGVALTPAVKNSVQTLVRTLEPKASLKVARAAAGASSQSDGTCTIMFTDIVGSSDLMERLGDRKGRSVLSRHDEIIRRQTAAHHGSEVKSMGDGFMLTFRSAHQALACAIAVQKSLTGHAREYPQAPIQVRMGLSVGEPVRDDKDLFGMSVIVAARIAAMAEGGQVLVSEIVYHLASSSGDFDFRPVGPVELKGVPGAQAIYEVLWSES
jgi:class 3 adenylate cyclase